MKSFIRGLETFAIGLAVVVLGAVIESLTNYHPTGQGAVVWSMCGVAVIGALRSLLSWLIIKQQSEKTEPPKA